MWSTITDAAWRFRRFGEWLLEQDIVLAGRYVLSGSITTPTGGILAGKKAADEVIRRREAAMAVK